MHTGSASEHSSTSTKRSKIYQYAYIRPGVIKFIYLFDVLWHTENISVLGWWPPLRVNETGEFPRESHNNAADLGDLRSLATIVSK